MKDMGGSSVSGPRGGRSRPELTPANPSAAEKPCTAVVMAGAKDLLRHFPEGVPAPSRGEFLQGLAQHSRLRGVLPAHPEHFGFVDSPRRLRALGHMPSRAWITTS
ncbi:hypothetical protein GCM10010446_14860 [Streptomyces enissocaesilis]|uniref:Uncharacterized protein n=1 Tax=Streptomyces enissocaesilis TaxID=332589 RepID=A0ABP6JGL1_9ACTN